MASMTNKFNHAGVMFQFAEIMETAVMKHSSAFLHTPNLHG
jgi:hypothetical protein